MSASCRKLHQGKRLGLHNDTCLCISRCFAITWKAYDMARDDTVPTAVYTVLQKYRADAD